MANARNSNSISIDTASETVVSTTTKIAYVIFTPDSANDQLVLKDGTSGGSVKLNVRGATAKDSMFFDFSANPLHFPSGIYVATLSSNATAILITSGGGN